MRVPRHLLALPLLLGLLLLPVMLAGCGARPPCVENASLANVLEWQGITYGPRYGQAEATFLAGSLGPQVGTVSDSLGGCQATTPAPRDFASTALAIGSPIYAVRGYATTFRLAARASNGLVLYEANANSHAQTGADLLDIGGKVVSISILSSSGTPLGEITQPAQVTAVVNLVLQAPIQRDVQVSPQPTYQIVFDLADSTTVQRGYDPGERLLGWFILVPPAFNTAIQNAIFAK